MKSLLIQFVGRVARAEFLVLACAALVALGLWGFVELADNVRERDTQKVDEAVLRWTRSESDPSQPIMPRWVTMAMRDITALGGFTVLTIMTAAVVAFLFLRGQHHAAWFVLAAAVGGVLLGQALKALFDRPRPDVVPHLTIVESSSFPSGHSMMSAVIYLTLGSLLARFAAERRVKIYVIALAMTLSLLIGVSRVYLGVHYPTDVLAGWTAGLVWALLCWLAARYLQKRGTVEKGDDQGFSNNPSGPH